MKHREIKILPNDVVRKIAAGEVVERPSSIVRELMDNAVDSGADKITVEITGGGIKSVKVADNGCGMSEKDLKIAATSHATSKISSEKDLMALNTLGFRGEALYSLAAVCDLIITSRGKRLTVLQNNKERKIFSYAETEGTIVECLELFSSFPARRLFLKREQSEALACKTTFTEKALPVSECAFSFIQNGELSLSLPKGLPLSSRFVKLMGVNESEELFYELEGEAGKDYSFTLLIGEPAVHRRNRKNIHIYVNGRHISEFALYHAIEYGTQGFFPNGTFPVACLFVNASPALVDFNIHPAKKEVRFADTSALHRAIVSTLKDFFRSYSARTYVFESLKKENEPFIPPSNQNPAISYDLKSTHFATHVEKNAPFIHSSFSSYLPSKGKTETKNKEEFTETKDEVKFLSQTLGTFLLAQKGDALYFIDQHAANERLLFNKFMNQKQNSKPLLFPYVIKVKDEAEDEWLKSIQKELLQGGFKIKKEKEGEWKVYSAPEMWRGGEKEFIRLVIEEKTEPSSLLYGICASAACLESVKDGDVLDFESAASLAKAALLLDDPHCPHGRPVYTTITREELFRLVRRKE